MNSIICSGAPSIFFFFLIIQRLFLHRTQTKQNNVWGLVGGRNESEEIPYKALLREIEEEIGSVPNIVKSIPLETFVSNDEKFSFHTYLCVVKNEFIPKLNFEHNGYAWVSFNNWPKPCTRLRNTLQNKQNLTKLQTVFQLVSLMEK